MPHYELRGYQVAAVETALWHLRNYASPFVIQAATGAGKSLIIADICHQLNEPVLILQPSKELLEQNYEKLLSYDPNIDAGIYSASFGKKEIAKYTYAMIGSIYKKPELFKHFKYVIIDECHDVNPKGFGMYKSFLTAINCHHVCGLTATPYRIVQKYVHVNSQLHYTATLKVINRIHPFFFKRIAFKVETAELIEQGYLAPIKYHDDKTSIDQLVVNSTGADFTTKSLSLWAMTKVERIVALCEFIEPNAKRNLVFCTSILQATMVVSELKNKGTLAEVVTGETPKKDRERIVAEFRDGKIKHLINVGVFTKGFDVPELNSIVLARPTMSLALYYQMVGRGVRIDPADPAKVLRVFDLAGVVAKLGRVETITLGSEAHPTIPNFRMDTVESEVGRMDEKALFSFLVKKKVAWNQT